MLECVDTISVYSIGGLMSKRPPEDNPFIEQILHELDVSMIGIDIESKEAMKEALRDSMGLWLPDIGTEPEITILDGDKRDGEDNLTIAHLSNDCTDDDGKETLRSKFQILDDDGILKEDELYPHVQVKVLSPQDLLSGSHNLFGLAEDSTSSSTSGRMFKRGRIVLEEGERLPVVQRTSVSPYRITCDQGSCVVHTQDRQYTLRTGQSIYVDVTTIELEAIETTTGWYQSL